LISDIYKAKAYRKVDITPSSDLDNSNIHYITRTDCDNGCETLASDVGYDRTENGNAITIGDTTSTVFYQAENFICGDHMVVIRAEWLNKYTGLYICTLLQKERYRYSYGRAFTMDNIVNTTLNLPINSAGNPDWEYMENYIKSLPYGDRI